MLLPQLRAASCLTSSGRSLNIAAAVAASLSSGVSRTRSFSMAAVAIPTANSAVVSGYLSGLRQEWMRTTVYQQGARSTKFVSKLQHFCSCVLKDDLVSLPLDAESCGRFRASVEEALSGIEAIHSQEPSAAAVACRYIDSVLSPESQIGRALGRYFDDCTVAGWHRRLGSVKSLCADDSAVRTASTDAPAGGRQIASAPASPAARTRVDSAADGTGNSDDLDASASAADGDSVTRVRRWFTFNPTVGGNTGARFAKQVSSFCGALREDDWSTTDGIKPKHKKNLRRNMDELITSAEGRCGDDVTSLRAALESILSVASSSSGSSNDSRTACLRHLFDVETVIDWERRVQAKLAALPPRPPTSSLSGIERASSAPTSAAPSAAASPATTPAKKGGGSKQSKSTTAPSTPAAGASSSAGNGVSSVKKKAASTAPLMEPVDAFPLSGTAEPPSASSNSIELELPSLPSAASAAGVVASLSVSLTPAKGRRKGAAAASTASTPQLPAHSSAAAPATPAAFRTPAKNNKGGSSSKATANGSGSAPPAAPTGTAAAVVSVPSTPVLSGRSSRASSSSCAAPPDATSCGAQVTKSVNGAAGGSGRKGRKSRSGSTASGADLSATAADSVTASLASLLLGEPASTHVTIFDRIAAEGGADDAAPDDSRAGVISRAAATGPRLDPTIDLAQAASLISPIKPAVFTAAGQIAEAIAAGTDLIDLDADRQLDEVEAAASSPTARRLALELDADVAVAAGASGTVGTGSVTITTSATEGADGMEVDDDVEDGEEEEEELDEEEEEGSDEEIDVTEALPSSSPVHVLALSLSPPLLRDLESHIQANFQATAPNALEEQRKREILTELQKVVAIALRGPSSGSSSRRGGSAHDEASSSAAPVLHIFGSSANQFGTASADIDVSIELPGTTAAAAAEEGGPDGVIDVTAASPAGADKRRNGRRGGAASVGPEFQLVKKVMRYSGSKFVDVNPIPSARIPIIKCTHSRYRIDVDLSFGNLLAVHNTRLLETYAQLHPAIRPFVFAVKAWAKARGVVGADRHNLSSYGLVLMALFYLQVEARLIPSLQDPLLMRDWEDYQRRRSGSSGPLTSLSSPVIVDGYDVRFVSDVAYVTSWWAQRQAASAGAPPSSPGKPSASAAASPSTADAAPLFAGFIDYYATRFQWARGVVSPRTGAVQPRSVFKAHKGAAPPSWRLAIEDPFELSHDLGRVLTEPRQMALWAEFHRARQLLKEAASASAASYSPAAAPVASYRFLPSAHPLAPLWQEGRTGLGRFVASSRAAKRRKREHAGRRGMHTVAGPGSAAGGTASTNASFSSQFSAASAASSPYASTSGGGGIRAPVSGFLELAEAHYAMLAAGLKLPFKEEAPETAPPMRGAGRQQQQRQQQQAYVPPPAQAPKPVAVVDRERDFPAMTSGPSLLTSRRESLASASTGTGAGDGAGGGSSTVARQLWASKAASSSSASAIIAPGRGAGAPSRPASSAGAAAARPATAAAAAGSGGGGAASRPPRPPPPPPSTKSAAGASSGTAKHGPSNQPKKAAAGQAAPPSRPAAGGGATKGATSSSSSSSTSAGGGGAAPRDPGPSAPPRAQQQQPVPRSARK